jgi:predicted ribosomally synthesized peptide with SipW-like signal peptide
MTSTRNRKGIVRAVLAGGIVLGVGAAITLAAWNASDFATGNFDAGTFAFQGSANGTDYALHTSEDPATLSFGDASDMSPDMTTYAAYWLRLGAGTTDDATVTVASGGATGVTGLTYGMTQIGATATCDASAATTGTSLVPAGTALDSVGATAPTFALTAGATSTDDGTPVQVCLAVTADTGLVQGQSGNATWQFTAESN